MDPRKILGVSVNATQEEIRAAYLRKIKEHPPESSSEEFERIRDAWDTLRDPRRHARSLLLADDPEAPFTSLVSDKTRNRHFVGPEVWLAALKWTITRG